ncbi:endonuclease/exonuclease/phosphatase family protein [Candidatus Uabimicrobium amorphum]|uniref:Endonuclease/exonuclease/phosphatase domain-containing protein n=1 Tax=Uabimicrobium amorphum TaxID=2596890 RepID=A0A5S9F7B4_UABAM|nr:endonuclease/exonuclease/phosphatase family protein [Candidatus Uabimicrobium amorphum]BBM88201.1 hypothetical protein UABAM_06622 [Candidatus Uabimicrobium amorphum]
MKKNKLKDYDVTLPSLVYHNNDWQVFSHNSSHKKSISQVTIVSFNVLFDLHAPGKLFTEQRQKLQWEILADSQADIIALQEVTPDFFEELLQQSWVNKYYVSHGGIETYGQIFLSRIPFRELHCYYFSPHKKFIFAQWEINSELFTATALHLTSRLAKNAPQKRAQQLQTILTYLKRYPSQTNILLGDFNFSDERESRILYDENFGDVWQQLQPQQQGLTFVPQINTIAAITSKSGISARYDRIYMQTTTTTRASNIKMIGNTPHTYKEQQIYPSDHFGLQCTFDLL